MYNHIPMFDLDEEHTFFNTDHGLYCYKMMPFGLKNARATYQRLGNIMFKDLIGKTMEMYMEDMLVKSKTLKDHVTYLEEMFAVLRRYKMKHNSLKCAFGVDSGKFLSLWLSREELKQI